jgi:ribonuclease R
MERKDKIIGLMSEAMYKPMKLGELAAVLDVPKEDRELLSAMLDELEQDGVIFKTAKDRYGLTERMNLIAGRLQGSERGYGFVIPDDEQLSDVFIPSDGINGAMNNDRVVARITTRGFGGKRAEGEIIKVLKRTNTRIVGTFDSSNNYGFVIPDDRKLTGDIFIPGDEINGAKPGYKVVAEIVRWPDKRRNAEGRITEIIGDSSEPGTDIVSILKAYNLNETFPENVVRQTESIPEAVTEEMLKDRKDLRGLRMVTIDGEDAKDLDDAVSIERLPDGLYRLGVHIADVSNYVTENSPLDVEALRRGTSVYLVDRVIPMLPKKLSNGVCSLNPNVDRLALTVMMDIDKNGKVKLHDIFKSVIKTNERMTYTDVYTLLEGHDEELEKRYDYLLDDFRTMKELALILRKKRMKRGAIDFDFPEAKIILDENGKPIDVKKYEITIANRIIEEFMLVCNETVAERFHWIGSPFVYRVHEEPDNEKIMAFAEFSSNLGYPLKGINKIHPRALQEILNNVKGTREETVLSNVMLRSLAKARYSHQNLGHFGLAADFYCHFTSPIRRYPDLIIHRIIKENLKGMLTDEREQELEQRLPDIAKQCSDREREADEAERETEDLKKVEYMKEQIGSTFDVIISGVTSFGMFVELENTIEGLVRVSNMDDDYYVYDDKHFCLIGEHTGNCYRIGDRLRVWLSKADMATRQLEFMIEERIYDDDETYGEEDGFEQHEQARKNKEQSRRNSNGRVVSKGKGKGAGKSSGKGTGKGRGRVKNGKYDSVLENAITAPGAGSASKPRKASRSGNEDEPDIISIAKHKKQSKSKSSDHKKAARSRKR